MCGKRKSGCTLFWLQLSNESRLTYRRMILPVWEATRHSNSSRSTPPFDTSPSNLGKNTSKARMLFSLRWNAAESWRRHLILHGVYMLKGSERDGHQRVCAFSAKCTYVALVNGDLILHRGRFLHDAASQNLQHCGGTIEPMDFNASARDRKKNTPGPQPISSTCPPIFLARST